MQIKMTVIIKFKDGEEAIERNVDEVEDSEDSLFLRRYGQAGVSYDKEDIASFKKN